MRTRMFYPKDGRPAITVSSLEEIRHYMGDIMNSGFDEIKIISGNLVVTYLNGLPITLGILK